MKKTITIFSTFIFLLFIGQHLMCQPDDHIIITKPKPTHVAKEKDYVQLEMVKEVGEEIDDEHFFARPITLATDKNGNIFVYDMILLKIFKFDKDCNLVKVFLKQGQGPGEILKEALGIRQLYMAENGNLYVNDPHNNKIIAFDNDGNHINDFRLPPITKRMFQPVVDKEGNFYTLSNRYLGIDVLGKNFKFQYSVLGNEQYYRYLIHRAKLPMKQQFILDGNLNDFSVYDVLTDGRLVVYLPNSSTIYIFKKVELIKSFDVWPEKPLLMLKKGVVESRKRAGDDAFEAHLFDHFFVDKDNETHVYFPTNPFEGDNRHPLYCFSLDGKLKNVYYTLKSVRFIDKRNNLFYGINRSGLCIYKVKERFNDNIKNKK